MKSSEVRRSFLDFFGERDHRVVPSSPLVLPNDPTLLFANAGMNQFKDVFTGAESRDYKRAATSQKCLRVSGKHNDLEMVGNTPRHQTFFEMLGNFSFGDYFKHEAISHAWELIHGVWGIPAERLWVSVFGGSDQFEADEQALGIWRDEIGFPEERILRLGEKDNFWRMGDTGPCGPCSEIHYDMGEDLTSVDGNPTPENDERRFTEIWNLVFMQFDQVADGSVRKLPAPSIDTGMGLERITSVLQGQRSNYDTDLFTPLLEAMAGRAGTRYGKDPEADFSMRVVADHSRAFCFLIADGIVPANDGRGYVLRRLLRRAIHHGRKLGVTEPFLHEITPVVVEILGGVYPEIAGAHQAALEVGKLEELRFADTLSVGLGRLEKAIDEAKGGEQDPAVIPGKAVFRLYDTFGFPLDLARDIARERGVQIDEAGFDVEMTRQRERAQASWKGGERARTDESYVELAGKHSTRFEGYERARVDGARTLVMLRDGEPVKGLKTGDEGELLLDVTPFYAEAGGQVADTGTLTGPGGRATVVDVRRPVPGLIVHRIRVDEGALAGGDRLCAEVDDVRRAAIRKNHTATHLLHAALREVVGTHVKQAGSLVAPDRLRFDFTHFAPLSERMIRDIESLINEKVMRNLAVETATLPLEEALRSGAMALFGEKYGDQVRVVRLGEFSTELCGGIHCERAGEIGLVKLTEEKGIASGTRRVEALTGTGSLDRFRREHGILRHLEEQLSVPGDRLLDEVARRLEQLRDYQKQIAQSHLALFRERLRGRIHEAHEVSGIKVLVERVDGLEPRMTRELADDVLGKLGSGVVVFGRADGAKASLLVAVTDDLKKQLPAGGIVKRLAGIIGGSGGGRPDRAEAGGKDSGRLDEALDGAVAEIARQMEASTP